MKRLILIILIGFTPILGFSQGCEEPSEDGGIKLFGYIQPQFDYNVDEGNTNSFNFNRARLGVTGVIPYDFSYYAVLEMSPSFNDARTPFLLDAYVSYNRFNWAKMALGQFKSPFSQELQTACHKLTTINRSKSVLELASPLRDMGFMISGGNDTTIVKYQLAVMNGTGLNTLDDNTGKDFVGRVVIQPLDFLQIGGSYRYGTGAPQEADLPDDTHMRYGFETQIKFGAFLLQGEYIYGKDEGSYTEGGGCGGEVTVLQGDKERRGFYGMASYMFDFGLQPVGKFEMYDNDISVDDKAEYITTLGLNYFFNDWTRLQINYCLIQESAIEQIDNDRLAIQMQIKF
ncbi:MAG: porin [Bacteroidota bacterium]